MPTLTLQTEQELDTGQVSGQGYNSIRGGGGGGEGSRDRILKKYFKCFDTVRVTTLEVKAAHRG